MARAVRRGAREIADIGITPNQSVGGVTVALDEARHHDIARETVIHRGRAHGVHELRTADAEDAPAAHRDVRGERQARVHGHDAAGLEDHGVRGHRATPSAYWAVGCSPGAGFPATMDETTGVFCSKCVNFWPSLA